jgi:hypothetical protein
MLIGFVFSRLLPEQGWRKSAWITAGAAAPDLPLIAIAIFCWIVSGYPAPATQDMSGFVGLVDRFYFDSETFITLHHLLHAPGSLALLVALCLAFGRISGRPVLPACWFLMGAATHCIVDLFTHAGDGVLVFWPFNWSYRFNAGVDQWDMQGAGGVVLMIEGGLFAIYGVSLIYIRLRPFYSFLTMSHA